MFHAVSNGLALSTTAILIELLKGMDGAKRNALIDRAAEVLEKGAEIEQQLRPSSGEVAYPRTT